MLAVENFATEVAKELLGPWRDHVVYEKRSLFWLPHVDYVIVSFLICTLTYFADLKRQQIYHFLALSMLCSID